MYRIGKESILSFPAICKFRDFSIAVVKNDVDEIDHLGLHAGIIWVHERLRAPLGEVIRSFKIACTKANLTMPAPIEIDGSATFWFPGLCDTILFSKGQLKKMTRYVLRNAERRWAVMQNPDLFKVTRSIDLYRALGERTAQPDIAALPATCDAVGNAFLAELPNKLLEMKNLSLK